MEDNNKIVFWFIVEDIDDYYDCREVYHYHHKNYEDALKRYKVISESYKNRYLEENGLDELAYDDLEWEEEINDDFSISFYIRSEDSFCATVDLQRIEL